MILLCVLIALFVHFTGGVKPEGHEDEHEMVNMEYACDQCQGFIIGHRINCNVFDNDFDLCYGCYVAMRYLERYLPVHLLTHRIV